jgi:hypothetical protein
MPEHLNIGPPISPIDDPKIAEFASRLEPIMSVGESIGALRNFAYKSHHATNLGFAWR